VGAVAVAIMLLAPCGVAFAEDAPPVDQPVVEVPVVEPPSIDVPASPVDLPPLPSEPVVEHPSEMPEGDPSWGPVPQPEQTEAPPTGVWAMSDADRIAYLTGLAQKEVDAALQQWGTQFLAASGGGSGSTASGAPSAPAMADAAAASVAASLAETGSGEAWIQLSTMIGERRIARPAASHGRPLSSPTSVRYEVPRTTEVAFILVNGSAHSTSVTVTWLSGDVKATDRVTVAAGATLQSVLALPRMQDSTGNVSEVSATFSSSATREEVSFVALASPVAPLDFPDSRGYATRTR